MTAVHATVRAGLVQVAGGGSRPSLALRNESFLLQTPACVSIGSTWSMHEERTEHLSYPISKLSPHVGIAGRVLKTNVLLQATER